MERPFRYRKRLIKIGNSSYALIPAEWKHSKKKDVIVEVYSDKIVILPVTNAK